MPADSAPHVVVVGAGVAGMAAAHALCVAGVNVTVLEKSTTIAGRCFSYVDPELGHTIEHGIHGVFPRYVNLRALWREAGIDDAVFSTTTTTGMAGADRKMHVTELAKVHGAAPFFLLHMTPPGVLRLRDYLLAARLLARLYAARWLRTPALEQSTFAALLEETGVSRRAAELLFVPYVRNLSYARPDEVSALVAASALDFYVVEHVDDVKARFFDGGPSALVFEPWRRWLEGRGVRFLLGTPAEQVVMQGSRCLAITTRAAIADADLGAVPRLWTLQLGGKYLALHWTPESRTLKAYDAHCTHQGCSLGVDTTGAVPCLRCPCHGGRFTADGQVMNAPPALPLPEIALRHDVEAGIWFVADVMPGPASEPGPTGPIALPADAAVLAMDLPSTQRVLPHELAVAESTRGIASLRTTGVIVLRLRFSARAGAPRWSGPDSGVFAASDVLDNFFVLHTFQREFRELPDLWIECHIGDGASLAQLSEDDLFDRSLGVLDRYFPGEGLTARLDRAKSRVLRHVDGLPLFAPGDAARAPTVSDARRPNLMFAGDWVRPDDPECDAMFMERAAVTGIEAANAILRLLGSAHRERPIERPSSPAVSRWISLPSLAKERFSAALRRLLDV
jgi:uncharacterized protein with NAD-binding domain and iron-sulfur cluster/nitrite reductase/ring-hydroxylating ferredoxin subunit